MDVVRKTFDKWAQNGRAELMEKEHGKNVSKFLNSILFDKPFTFLDVGCGNGWVVRKIVNEDNCNVFCSCNYLLADVVSLLLKGIHYLLT